MAGRHRQGRLRDRALGFGRATYRTLRRTPLRRLLDNGLVERVRARAHRDIEAADVFEVLDVLEAARVRAWLAGGWATDALIGRQTRPHRDLDMVVHTCDLERAVAVLAEAGFERIPEAAEHVPGALLPDRRALQDGAGRVVDLHPVDPPAWSSQRFFREPFTTGTIAGRTVPCLGAEAQIAGREGYELEPEDRHDIALLRAVAAG